MNDDAPTLADLLNVVELDAVIDRLKAGTLHLFKGGLETSDQMIRWLQTRDADPSA